MRRGALKNRHGESYIKVCVIIIALCMLLSVFISFVSAVGIIRQVKRNTRVVLDSYVTQNSIEIYNSIKNGSDHTELLDSAGYISEFSSFNSLDFYGNMLYSYNVDGNEQYRLTLPTMSFIQDKQLKISVKYDITIPLYFAGVRVTEVTVPITVVSRLNEKF